MQRSRIGTAFWAIMAILFVQITLGIAQAQPKPDIVNFITNDGLAEGSPVTITVDPQDWVWIGSSSMDKEGIGGMSVINKNRHIFSFTREDGLASNSVNDVELDPMGDCIWVATSAGLSCWNGKTGKWQNYSKSNSDLKSNDINCIYIDPDGNRWIGTHGEGLYWIKSGDKKIESVKCPLGKVTSVIMDKKKRLWVASFEGVAYREGNAWVTYNKDSSNLPDNKVYDLLEGPSGEIYAATKRGLATFDGLTWSVQDSKNSPLPVDHTSALLMDKKGNLWVGTWGGGLVKFDEKRHKAVVYNRKNSAILDNQIADIAQDSAGNLWLATARGVSHLIVNPQQVIPEVVTAVNEQAFRWENRSGPGEEITTMHSLALNRYGYVVWGYSAYFSDKDFNRIDPNVTISWNILDNRWLNVTEKSAMREFLNVCVTEGKVTRHYTPDRTIIYPFPDKFPPELQVYLKPGKFIPSDDPNIVKLAKSLVRNSSKGDMERTAEDILLSKLFATMPYDYTKAKGEESASTNDPREKSVSIPQEVLRENIGTNYSKNRLAVALLRSVGIPARLIFKNGNQVWGEAYINGWGWVPFDVSFPIYTQGEEAPNRIVFPKVVDKADLGVAWVAGTNDDSRTIHWTPSVESVFTKGAARVEDLKKIEKLQNAQLLVIRPSSAEVIPNESKIPVSRTLLLMVKKDGDFFNLRFFDKNGQIVKKVPITEYYKTTTAQVEGKVKMTFIPSYMGEYLILRMFEWELKD